MDRKLELLLILITSGIVAFMAYYSIIALLVDYHLLHYSDLGRSESIMKFYEKSSGGIYIWGPSTVKEAVDAGIVSQQLGQDAYNLGNPASSPIRSLVEYKAAIASKPKAVVWGATYFSLSGNWLVPYDQYALLSQYAPETGVFSDDLNKLLNMNKLQLLIYKRKFVKNAAAKVLFSKIAKPLDYYRYNTDFKSSGILAKINKTGDEGFLDQINHKTNFSEYFVPESNKEMMAMEQITAEFKKNNIELIIVKLPLHPLLLDKLPKESKDNFNDFIDGLSKEYDLAVLDYETVFNGTDFYDGHHLSAANIEKFSLMLADDLKGVI